MRLALVTIIWAQWKEKTVWRSYNGKCLALDGSCLATPPYMEDCSDEGRPGSVEMSIKAPCSYSFIGVVAHVIMRTGIKEHFYIRQPSFRTDLFHHLDITLCSFFHPVKGVEVTLFLQ
jgi:hypothetical protein